MFMNWSMEDQLWLCGHHKKPCFVFSPDSVLLPPALSPEEYNKLATQLKIKRNAPTTTTTTLPSPFPWPWCSDRLFTASKSNLRNCVDHNPSPLFGGIFSSSSLLEDFGEALSVGAAPVKWRHPPASHPKQGGWRGKGAFASLSVRLDYCFCILTLTTN